MNKKIILSLSAFMVMSIGLSQSNISKAADYYAQAPELGSVSADSYFVPAWTSRLGAKRVSDRAVVVKDISDWGYRGNFANRTFDATSFEISLNLKEMKGGQAATLIFGSAPGSYTSEGSMQLTFDIVTAVTDTSKYIVTCSNTLNGHNISIPGFTDGGTWADDANFTGVQVATTDYNISIGINKISEAVTKVSVNDIETEVATSDIFQRFENPQVTNVSLGFFNVSGSSLNYVINSVGDASDEVYFGSTGAFTLVKNGLASMADPDLSTTDKIIEAKDAFEALPWSSLYSHDKAYFQADYDAIKIKINEAVEAAGNAVAVDLFATSVANLKVATENINTVEKALNAASLYKAAEELKTKIDVEALSGAILDKYTEALNDFNNSYAAIQKAAPLLYETAVTEYDNKVKGLANVEDLDIAEKLRSAIPSSLYEYLSDEKKTEMDAKILAIDASYKEQTTFTHDNWNQGNYAKVLVTEDNELGLYSYGGNTAGAVSDTAGLFNKEKISAVDFEATINVSKLSSNIGSWITLGIMEKPEMWINAESDLVQENKGIFFLITRVNSTEMNIQAFLCSLTSNRFYDSVLNQTINIPYTNDVKIRFTEETKTIAGVSDSYFTMTFNGVGFDQETITSRKLKTILGAEKEGYFIINTSGGSQNDPFALTIKDINGVKPNAATIVKEVDKTPTSTDTSASFKLGNTTNKVTFNLDTKGLDLTAVKVDGTAIENTKYTFVDNKLSLNNDYLNTLSVGKHTVVAETSSGSVTWELTIEEADKEVDKPKKGGCGGSIIATTSLVGMIALLGCGIAIKRKKETR